MCCVSILPGEMTASSGLHREIFILFTPDVNIFFTKSDDVLVVAVDVVTETSETLLRNFGTVHSHQKHD